MFNGFIGVLFFYWIIREENQNGFYFSGPSGLWTNKKMFIVSPASVGPVRCVN